MRFSFLLAPLALTLAACTSDDRAATFQGRFDWFGGDRLELRDGEGRLSVPAADARAEVYLDRAQDLLALRAGDREYRFTLPEGVGAQEGVWGFLAPATSAQPVALRAKFEQVVTDSYEYTSRLYCKTYDVCRTKPTEPAQYQLCDGRRTVTYLHEDYVDTLTVELGDSAQVSAEAFRASGRFVGTHADSAERKVGTSTCQIPL